MAVSQLSLVLLCTVVCCTFNLVEETSSGNKSVGVTKLTDQEQGLLEIARKIRNLQLTNKTLDNLGALYDRILDLYKSRPINDSYLEVIHNANSKILQNTADILGNLSLVQVTQHSTIAHRTYIKLVDRLDYNENQVMHRNNFVGGQVPMDIYVYINVMCIITYYRRIAIVVYPSENSPMHPLPVTQYPITSYQIFDLVIVELDGAPSHIVEQDCNNYEYLDMIIYRWDEHREFDLKASLYYCQIWSEVVDDWTSDGCKVIVDWDLPPKVSCVCDVHDNVKKTVEYIAYSVLQDLEVKNDINYLFYECDLPVDPYQDMEPNDVLKEYIKAIIDIAKDEDNVTEYVFRMAFQQYFSPIMAFENKDLFGNNRTDDLLEALGKLLANMQINNGSFFGLRNLDVTTFIMDIDTYNGDPIIAYTMFKDMENLGAYYRLGDEIDLNNLFSPKMEYSLMFSPEVLVENARYAVLVYPTNRYFCPATWIGHNVTKMRVVDVVLTPYPNLLDTHEQLVHMYFGRPVDEFVDVKKYGCARWSTVIGNWTTNGCYSNSVLYRGVCTCSMTAGFQESRTRAQFITFEYRVVDFNSFQGETQLDYVDTEFIEAAIFSLKKLKTKYPYGGRTVNKALELISELLIRTDGTYRFLNSSKESMIGDMREIAINNDCYPEQWYNNFGIVCYDKLKSASNQTVAFSYNKTLNNYDLNAYTLDTYSDSILYNENITFAVRVSKSVTTQNVCYAFFVYKPNIFLRPQPIIDETICISRVVDVILLPGENENPVEEFVEIYLAQTEYNGTRLGCAYWSYELHGWTSLGCYVNVINHHEVCNCSLIPTFYKGSRKGGQYIAYTSIEAYFDEEVYARLGSETVTNSHEIFVQGAALIHNASQIPVDDDMVTKILEVYVKILTHSKDEIVGGEGWKQIVSDLDVTFSRYCINLKKTYHHSVGIKGAWSVNNANLNSDLFTNAVLGENATDAISMASDMAVVVIGYYQFGSQRSSGVFFNRSNSKVAGLDHYTDGVVVHPDDTVFACYLLQADILFAFRMIFIIYPINMSPFPNTMTTSPVFNSRQIDIYTDLDNDDFKPFVKNVSGQPDVTHVDLYFQPAEKTENYVILGCASWNQNEWTEDSCVIVQLAQERPFCRCDITGRRVAQIVVYEYTNMPNFTFLTSLPGPTILYLVGAVLSLFGFMVIALTAFFFDKWREELGNRIMMQLSAASFIYLCLTMFRETHKIYATTNHMDIGLIIFTVLVHYTRLSHYCWGLVMSVLQYKKFSGVVGASTVSHLLLKVSLFAWGAPLVPLILLLTWDQKVHFCGPDKLTHYILYLVPGGIITALSAGFLVAIVCTITSCFGFTAVKDLERHGVDNKEVIKRHLMQTLMMFFLFGIPTLFEMFNDLVSHSVGAEYIGKILDPIQGFVMFIFFIVLDTKVSGYWYVKIYGKPKVQPQVSVKKVPVKVPTVKKRRVAPMRVRATPVEEEGKDDENDLPELHEVVVEAGEIVNRDAIIIARVDNAVDIVVDNTMAGSDDTVEPGVDSHDYTKILSEEQNPCQFVTENENETKVALFTDRELN